MNEGSVHSFKFGVDDDGDFSPFTGSTVGFSAFEVVHGLELGTVYEADELFFTAGFGHEGYDDADTAADREPEERAGEFVAGFAHTKGEGLKEEVVQGFVEGKSDEYSTTDHGGEGGFGAVAFPENTQEDGADNRWGNSCGEHAVCGVDAVLFHEDDDKQYADEYGAGRDTGDPEVVLIGGFGFNVGAINVVEYD